MLARLGCGASSKRPLTEHKPLSYDDADVDEGLSVLVAIPTSIEYVYVIRIVLTGPEAPRIVDLAELIADATGIPTGKQELYYRERHVKDLTKVRWRSCGGPTGLCGGGKSIIFCVSGHREQLEAAAKKLGGDGGAREVRLRTLVGLVEDAQEHQQRQHKHKQKKKDGGKDTGENETEKEKRHEEKDGSESVSESDDDLQVQLPHRHWFREQRVLRRRRTDASNSETKAKAKAKAKPDIERTTQELHSAFKSTAADAVVALIGEDDKVSGPLHSYPYLNIWGAGGHTHAIGGMIIHEFEGSEIALFPKVKGDTASKLANLECAGLDALEAVHDTVLVPLHAVVDFCGRRFLAVAPPPISPVRSLVYGSLASGLVARGELKEKGKDNAGAGAGAGAGAENVADSFPSNEIAGSLNLAWHRIVERSSGREVPFTLPVLTQWHRLPKPAVDGQSQTSAASASASTSTSMSLYTPIGGMFIHPPDLQASRKPSGAPVTLLSQRLRPEFCKTYGGGSAGTLAPKYTHYQSAAPVRCDSCETIVTTQTYMSNGQVDICSACFANSSSPTLNLSATVDLSSLNRVDVPESAMTEFWVHEDGHVSFQKPTVPVPLNADSYQITLGFGEPAGITELQRAHTVLYTEVLGSLLRDMGGCVGTVGGGDNNDDDQDEDHEAEAEAEAADARSGVNLVPIGGAALVSEMHARGLNVRMLGCVTKKSTVPHVRYIAEAEIVARCCAVLTRQVLAESGAGEDSKTEAKAKRAKVAAYLTELMRALASVMDESADENEDKDRAKSGLFAQVAALADHKYHIDLTASTMGDVHLPVVLHRICEMAGIVLRRPRDVYAPGYPLPWSGADTLLTAGDVKAIKPVVKQAPVFSSVADRALSEAQAAYEAAAVCMCGCEDGIGGGDGGGGGGGGGDCTHWDEASQAYRRMISIVQFVYGTDHVFVVSAYSAFGAHLLERLRLMVAAEAGAVARAALEAGCEPEVVQSRWNPLVGTGSRVYESTLYAEAISVWERVYDLSIDVCGYASATTADAAHALAQLLWAKAKSNMKTQVQADAQVQGQGQVQSQLEPKSESELPVRYLTEAALITEALVGPCHPAAALIWFEASHMYAEGGGWMEASACVRRSLAGASRVFGLESTEVHLAHDDLLVFERNAGVIESQSEFTGMTLREICTLLCDCEGLPPPLPPKPKPKPKMQPKPKQRTPLAGSGSAPHGDKGKGKGKGKPAAKVPDSKGKQNRRAGEALHVPAAEPAPKSKADAAPQPAPASASASASAAAGEAKKKRRRRKAAK